MVVVMDYNVGRGSISGGSGGGSGFDTTMRWVQERHLKLAALPLILEGSIRYFFPHSSQITIIPFLLKPEPSK
jgi:hypothetical protein